jgi:hypothetical protein
MGQPASVITGLSKPASAMGRVGPAFDYPSHRAVLFVSVAESFTSYVLAIVCSLRLA